MTDLEPGEAFALERLKNAMLGAPPKPVVLGRYELREKLGEGAHSEVFRAYDPKIRREVALKMLRCEDPEGIRRLTREARAIATLRHRGIVRFIDLGEAVDPRSGRRTPYVVMELVRGKTLQRWAAETAPTWRDLCRMFARIGDALAYAHRRGIVHRDFKPANVMITPRGEVRVLDFGLARRAEGFTSGSGVTGTLTAPGVAVGTPLFMAPEQHTGDRVGPAADQFAFCATLFFCVYGRPPFTGDNAFHLADAKVRGRLAPGDPSRAPTALYDTLARGLRPKAHERWPSMQPLLRQLRGQARRIPLAWVVVAGTVGIAAGVAAGALLFAL